MNHLRQRHFRHRVILGTLSLAGFAFLYLAARLFGNEGIEYLFAEVDRRAMHIAGHILVYGTLVVMLAKAMGNRYVLAWVIGNMLAAGEEWHQLVVPGRVASLQDAMLNVIAITTFLVLVGWHDITLRSELGIASAKPERHEPLPITASASQSVLTRAG